MAEEKIVYTVALTNTAGTIAINYLKPNYLNPREALWALRREQTQNPRNTYRVFRYSGTFFDENELRAWIDENVKKA